MRSTTFFIALFLGIAFIISCDKEDLDITDTEVSEFDSEVVVVDCELNTEIVAAAAGSLTVNAVGGIEPYKYLWSTGEETNTIESDTDGIYRVTVTDQRSCFAVDSTSVGMPCNIALSISGGDQLCCFLNFGLKPYTYLWDSGETTACILRAVEDPGYSCTITDANGCSSAGIINFPDQEACSNLEAVISENSPGNIVINPMNGTPPYSFLWETGETTQSITVPHNGVYSVTVLDGGGCGIIKKILSKPSGPCIDFTAKFEPVGLDRLLSVAPIGGSGNYSYLWSTGETTNPIKITSSDVFEVTITDENTGCIYTDATLEPYNNPLCNRTSVSIDKFSFDRPEIEANAVGGEPPYTYDWLNGMTGPSIPNIGQAVIKVAITDANGCIATDTAFGLEDECNNLQVAIDTVSANELTSIVSGGTPPYTYQWSTGETSSSIPIIENGIYIITVTDAIGCITANYFEFYSIPDLCEDLIIEILDTSEIDQLGVSVSGSSGNYEYLWNTDVQFTQSNQITVLESGDYSVTISDLDLGCTKEVELVYALSDNCNDFAGKLLESTPGTLEITTCGGEAPYTYSWPFEQPAVLTNLASGLYSFTITDSDGCLVILSHEVD